MKPHHRIFGVQFLFAVSMGALLSRLADLQLEWGLTEGQLALLLVSMSVGVLTGLTFAARFIDALGARRTTLIAVFAASALYALIPWMPSALFAAPLFLVAGALAGALEVNLNLETDRHEAVLGYRIMSRSHGMWSLGFFVTALVSATVRQAGVSVETHLLVVLAVVLVAGWIVFSRIDNAPARPHSHEGESPAFAFPSVGLLPLCLIGAAPLFAEGAGVDWSVIYMRDVFAVEPFISGLSVAIFSLVMAIARLGMDPIIDRYGPRRIAALLIGLASTGLVLVATAHHPSLALLGFALVGLGCSSVYPIAISAVAQRTDRPAPVNVAALGQMTFVVLFAGPPVLGFVAEHFGIRASYWTVVPPMLAALLAIRVLPAGSGSEAVAARSAGHRD